MELSACVPVGFLAVRVQRFALVVLSVVDHEFCEGHRCRDQISSALDILLDRLKLIRIDCFIGQQKVYWPPAVLGYPVTRIILSSESDGRYHRHSMEFIAFIYIFQREGILPALGKNGYD